VLQEYLSALITVMEPKSFFDQLWKTRLPISMAGEQSYIVLALTLPLSRMPSAVAALKVEAGGYSPRKARASIGSRGSCVSSSHFFVEMFGTKLFRSK
jgi:hypothetical protein